MEDCSWTPRVCCWLHVKSETTLASKCSITPSELSSSPLIPVRPSSSVPRGWPPLVMATSSSSTWVMTVSRSSGTCKLLEEIIKEDNQLRRWYKVCDYLFWKIIDDYWKYYVLGTVIGTWSSSSTAVLMPGAEGHRECGLQYIQGSRVSFQKL